MGFMNTPIIKAKKGSEEKLFYNEGQYDLWKDNTNIQGWNIALAGCLLATKA